MSATTAKFTVVAQVKGPNTIYAWSVDRAGNVGPYNSVSVMVS